METRLQPFIDHWISLPLGKRLGAVFSSLAVLAAVLFIARLAMAPSMALLYNGLAPEPAGGVVQALTQRGVEHEVRGDAIYVEASQRDELRLLLASEGLPANSSKGYELLDNLTGFGTTSQMFDAAYWRAKEGELARTIAGSPGISNARVHIAQVSANLFANSAQPSASVTVQKTGAALTPSQIRAMKFLVASAVAGLTPDQVAVIDGATGLVTLDDGQVEAAGQLQRSEDLRQKIQRLLEARVGPGNAVVEVSLDLATTTESIRERTFDPESRVAISTDTEQRTTNARGGVSGDVTVASNLPDGDAAGGAGGSSENSESRERVNYEVSETEREILIAPGDIKRITVAVLVNHTSSIDEEGNQVAVPRAEGEMEVLEELVASAIGFDNARGDKITIKTLLFEPVVAEGSAAGSGLFHFSNLDAVSIIKAALLSLVTLVLGLFVLRPILMQSIVNDAGSDLVIPAPAVALETPPIDSIETVETLPSVVDPMDSPAERLRELISGRQDETIEILRSWMDDREEKV